MRLLLLLLGLTVGLAFAAATGLRMSHLREHVPDRLPGWSAPVEDGAGLLHGTAAPVAIAGEPFTLTWDFDRLEGEGATWSLRAERPGQALAGDVTVSYDTRRLLLRDGRGELDLAALEALPGQLGLEGTLRIEGAAAEVLRPERRIVSAGGEGRWTGARLDGQELGLGTFRLEPRPIGWRAPFLIEGPTVVAEGSLEGRYGQTAVVVDMTVTDAGAMPKGWKDLLDTIAEKDGETWTIRRRIELRGIAGF